MSELQISLMGFGALVVAAVWVYNLWQARRLRQRAETILPQASTSDVLMAGRESEPAVLRNEPSFGNAVLQEPTFSDGSMPERGIPALRPEDTLADGMHRSVPPLPGEWADGKVDCLLRVEFVDAVPVSALWAEQANWSGALDKPLQWLGLDDRTERWRSLLPQDSGNVSQIAAALQLVDRRGALGESALGTFLGGVHQLAQHFSGLVELPEHAPVLVRARELDAYCASLDLQLSLLVLPRQGSLSDMMGAKLKSVIEEGGLRLEGERFVATDADGAEVFALSCQSSTAFPMAQIDKQGVTGLTFSLDVPRVADGVKAFDRMVGFIRLCAEALGGQLTDAHKKPLPEATLAAIRQRIGELQGQMVQAGFPPGSVRALRLFS